MCWTPRRQFLRGRCAAVAKSMDAAETIQEFESTGLAVGEEKTHWTSFPRMENSCLQVDGGLVM